MVFDGLFPPILISVFLYADNMKSHSLHDIYFIDFWLFLLYLDVQPKNLML